MHRFHRIAAILTLLSAITLIATAFAAYPSSRNLADVGSVKLDWTDAARNRAVPVKIYFPKHVDAPLPVILFSHGLGGSRDGYSYLGEHWAANGYVVVHLQHLGSDDATWRGQQNPIESLRKAVMDPRNAVDRVNDVTFAIDQLTELNKSDVKFKGKLDLEHIGLAGHSFGAHTTLVSAGESLGGRKSLLEPRVKAIIPISAPAPMIRLDLDKTFGAITVPCLHITGTLDDSPIGETTAAERRIPFDHMSRSEEYLITFEGADHMVFSGSQGRAMAKARNAEHDHAVQQLTQESTTAFWDAYLKTDAAAKNWLGDGGLVKSLGAAASLEHR